MENPATWGPVERVIQAAMAEAAENRNKGIYGPSEIRLIADRLREADLIKQ